MKLNSECCTLSRVRRAVRLFIEMRWVEATHNLGSERSPHHNHNGPATLPELSEWTLLPVEWKYPILSAIMNINLEPIC